MILNQRFHDNSLNDTESIGFAFFLSGMSLLLMDRNSRWISLLGGAALGAAVMTKEPFIFSVIPTYIACIFLRPRASRSDSRRLAVWGAAGGVLFGIAITVYLALAGSLGAYLDSIAFSRRFADDYSIALGIFHRSNFIGEWSQSLSALHHGLINWQNLGILSPFLAAGVISALVLLRGGALLSVLAVLGGLYSVTLGHCFWLHYFIMVFGPLALLSVAGADVIARIMTGLMRWIVRITLVLLMLFAVGPRVKTEIGKKYSRPGPPFSPELIQFIRETSLPTDTIFSTGEPGIYAYANRRSALTNGSYVDEFLALLPGTSDEEKVAPALAELKRKKPKIVFFESALSEERKRRYFRALFLPYVKSMGYREVRPDIFVLP
jgi:hypothetical protein